MCVSWIQLCLTLCDPMHCSPPGSSDHGIFQARILKWVAIPSFRGSPHLPNPGIKPRYPVLHVDYLPSESPGKPKNTGVGSLSLSPGELLNPGIEPGSPALQADFLLSEPPGKPKNTGVGSLFPSPGDLPNSGIEPGSPALQATFIISSLSTSGMEGLGGS